MKPVLSVLIAVGLFAGCQREAASQNMVEGSPYIYNSAANEKHIVLRVAGNRYVLFDQTVLGKETEVIFIQPETLSCTEPLEVAVVTSDAKVNERSFQRVSGDLCQITEHKPKVLMIAESATQARFEVVPVDYE